MEDRYWLGRKRAAMAMARNASTAESRLIHYELAGRYSIQDDKRLPIVSAAAAAAATRPPVETMRPVAPPPQPLAPLLPASRPGRALSHPAAKE